MYYLKYTRKRRGDHFEWPRDATRKRFAFLRGRGEIKFEEGWPEGDGKVNVIVVDGIYSIKIIIMIVVCSKYNWHVSFFPADAALPLFI